MISLVTGTYNRLPQLQNMIASARAACESDLLHEIIVVDGGSTDGTQAWCHQQASVHLIEHGSLKGAIKAFCDGATAATGEYVILANDDIVFSPHSITRAFVYLEGHPDCGAVAFADNRPSPGYGPGYKVQLMDARSGDGTLQDAVPYAQVGMFRGWLGELCGWWGADDDIMRTAHTYGGDNYLSARIWEYGYRVVPVEGCRVDDLVHEDGLREHNLEIERKRSGAYYRRFPGGVYVGWRSKPTNPQRERMRVLYLPLFEPGYDWRYKSGLYDALSKVAHVTEVNYLKRGGEALADVVTRWQPHLMLTQVHNPADLPASTLQDARIQCPSMVVVNWNGDVYPDALTSPETLRWLKEVDLQLTVNADALPVYSASGVTAAYWQIGYEPVIEDNLPDMPSHDVVFLGNCYSDARRELGAALRSADAGIGIYGRGWADADGDTLYDFAAGRALYRNATIAIGDNQWDDQGFVSNRLFEALAAGVLLLHQHVPGLEDLTGLVDGVHYVGWSDLDDLQQKVAAWLAQPSEAARIAAEGQRAVQKDHSFDARVRQLFERHLSMLEGVAV